MEEGVKEGSPAVKFLEKTTHCSLPSIEPEMRVASLEHTPDESTTSGQAPFPLPH